MIKYLFILVNSITLFIYSLLGGDNPISIANNIPKNLKPGQEIPIEITVTKGSMSGFAKLQLDLPEGLSIKEGDSRGANFNYSEGLAKWVWSNLPTDENLVVKCTLIASTSFNGTKTIGGKYSYVENNGKKVVEMLPVEITSGEGSPVASETPTVSNAGSGTVAVTGNTTTSDSNSEPEGEISAKRTITPGANEGEYIIELKISKLMTKGFARYSDDIPSEVTAKSIKTEGASFSVSDGKLKFVWVAVPNQEFLDISYTLIGVKNQLQLNGEYSYLEQNQSKTFNLKPEMIGSGNAVAVNSNTSSETPSVNTETKTNTPETNTVTETPTVALTPTENPVNTNTETPNTNTQVAVTPTENPVNETLPKSEGNINYYVQIGAFTNGNVDARRLAKKFSISENIKSEMAGGFSKFMVGNHAEYKNARDHREKMRNSNKIATAFVVAYNTGKRITVQEALMISNQKWYR